MILTLAALVAAGLSVSLIIRLRRSSLASHWSPEAEPARLYLMEARVEVRKDGPGITIYPHCRIIATDDRLIIARRRLLGGYAVAAAVDRRPTAAMHSERAGFVVLGLAGLDRMAMPRGIPPCLVMRSRDASVPLREISIIHRDHTAITALHAILSE